MASWFTRAIDRVTPWNRGGELQRRQEKKKREEEQAQQNTAPQQSGGLRVTNAQPTQRVVVDTPQLPQPKQPQNIFEDLNKGLVFNKPNNALDIIKSEASKPVERPAPGTVIQPRVRVDNSPTNMRIKLSDGRYADEIPDTPEQTLNKELDRGRSFEDIARDNRFDINAVREYATITRPNYGIKKMEKPKQSIGNRFRDVFDTNTESDKYRRQQGNIIKGEEKDITLKNPGNIVSRTPVVGQVTKMLNTAAGQIAQLPATVDGAILTKMSSDLTKEMLDAQKRGDTWAYQEAKRKLDLLAPEIERAFREQDAAHTMFEKNNGGLFNTGTLYGEEGSRSGDAETALKDIALPTAVSMLDLYTLGLGNLATEGVQQAGLRKVLGEGVEITAKKGAKEVSKNIGKTVGKKELAKLVAGNYASGDLSARSEGATGLDPTKAGLINSILGLVPDVGLPTAWRGFTNRVVPKFLKGSKVAAKDVVEELDDAAISASAEAANQAMKPRPITVAKNIPVDAADGLGEVINVRNLNEPAPLIREFPGDASVATPDALVKKMAEDTRAQAIADRAFDEAKTAPKPNPAIEGVVPRSPEAPYKLDEKAVVTAQDKMIDEYATWLREVGEGNGTQLVPDGQGGYYRTSNNIRFGDTKGKRMSKAAWRDEAERQLRSGQADPELQKAFDEAANPEVQSMLAKGEQPEASVGTPIKVQQATGIPVRDEINVPTNLPETPGSVRVTQANAPNNTKSATVAAQTPAPILPKEVQEILDNPKQFNKRQVASEVSEDTTKVLDTGSSGTDISPARRDLIYSLQEANKQSVRDARALSVARGERAGKASAMAEGLEGEAATRARRAGFKGELGHRGRYVGIGGEDGERVFNDLRIEAQRNPELAKRIYTLDNVEEALSRAVRGTDLKGNVVGAPTKGQIELLRKYFGEDVGDAVEEAVNISKSLKDQALETAGKAVATPRAIMSSLDFSATLRQGGVLSSRFPKQAAKAAREQLRYFASKDAFKEGMEEIANRSSYDAMLKSGLDVTGTSGLSKAEEQFIDNFAGKIPIIGRGVDASERAYTGFLTKLRADVFDKVRNGYLEQGIELSQRELDDLSRFINTASGRGSLGRLEDHAKTLSTTLFSPRLWKSRLDMLNPVYYAKLSGPARKLALQSAATYASIATTVLGLAAAAGANVETDLRSSDFGKIKVGNNRYDVLGGFQQNLVFAWRELTGEKKSSTTGETTKFARGIPDLIKGRSDEEAGVETGPYTPNRVSVASDLATNKANPVLGAVGRVLAGKDRGGNPVDPLEELARLAVPLSVSGAWDTANDIGDATNPVDLAKGALISSPSVIGVSSQTYGDVPTKDKNYDKYAQAKDRATKLRDEGAITDSSKVKDVIDNGDYDLALKSYEYEKAQAEASPKTTQKDIARIDEKIKEVKYLQQGVPRTDDGILAKAENGDYDKAIAGLEWKIERGQADGEMSSKSRKEIETDIKRFGIARDRQIPYELISDYKSIGVEDWRKMGIPPEDDNHDPDLYNPEMYQKLWELDQKMTKAGVSYRKGSLDKNKYFLKEKKAGSGSGRGGSGSRNLGGDFGRLDGNIFAPKVQAYDTIDQQSGAIPIIRTVRPNIVHKISASR